MTSQHKYLTRRHKDLTNQDNFLTSDGRNIPRLILTDRKFYGHGQNDGIVLYIYIKQFGSLS